MFRAAEMSPRARRVAVRLIHGWWEWTCGVAAISPTDGRGRRFRAMGPSSCISFPPGPIVGARWIEIGGGTLIGPNVTLSVGMPGEPLDPLAPAVIRIGERCNIGRGSSLVGRTGITIDDDVTIAPNVYVTDHNHTYADIDVPITRQWPAEEPVLIGAGSWLGTNAVVLPGTRLGRNVVIGAGTVVGGEVPDHSVVVGSSARVVRQFVDGEWVPPIRRQEIRPPAGWDVRRSR